MPLASDKNVLIFLLVSLGLIALPHVNHVPLPIFGFFYLLLTWRLLAIGKPNYLPGFNLTFFLTLAAMVLLFTQHQGVFGRDAGTSLLMAALALKFMELRKTRDVYLTIYLAFVMAATQFLYQQSLIMLAYIFIVVILLLAVLVTQNSRAMATLPAIKMAAMLGMQALPIALAIFFLFPRIDAPRLQWLSERNHRLSSLSDFIEPGSISDLSLSEELVFRVRFFGPLPPPSLRYWRGPVMTHTDGKRWTQSKVTNQNTKSEEPSVSGNLFQYVILMEPQGKNWVFALDMPVDYPPQLQRNAYYQLTTSLNPERRSEYRIDSYPAFHTGAISSVHLQEALQLPSEPSQRIKSLIRLLHGYDTPPEVYISELLRHFRMENFRYTLTPPKLQDNPIETFLFETRSGFCSHYASTFVYLMRAANIPARIVSGFLGGTYNDVGHFLEVRQKDAHAWAEVWLPDKGWTRVDPTAAIAPERIENAYDVDSLFPDGEIIFDDVNAGGAVDQWLGQLQSLWGSADYNWQHWIINYNSLNQANTLSRFGIRDAKSMVLWLTLIVAVMMAVIGTFLLFFRAHDTDRVVWAYRRFCNKLARKGLIRHQSEGARDFAERAKIRIPGHSEDIDRITELFIRLRYGRLPQPSDVKQLGRLVSLFKIDS